MGPEICFGCFRDLPRAARSCPICARPVSTEGACGCCLLRRPVYDKARVPFVYAFPVDRMIQRLKYNGILSHARLLGELVGHALGRTDGRPEAIAPVPPHPRRLRQRGFDQVIEIARFVAALTRVPLVSGLCVRLLDTPPLWPLGAQERRRILTGAFECRVRPPERVAVFDDILTTGSTADAMASALRSAGAREVEVWAVARSPSLAALNS